MSSINKSLIAKNTVALYFRMLLTMLIGLYTTRKVTEVLGVEDFGTYSAIAAVVLMLVFLSGTMATAAQRFFAVELGVNNHTRLKQIFSVNVLIFIGLAFIIFILAETVGLWFFKVKMDLPVDRLDAAHWVFQFAVLTLMAGIMTTPYLAIITAREQMKVYAYLSILEVIFKLAVVFVLLYFPVDKLKLYALLLFFVQILISATYIIYATVKFPECRIKYYWNKQMFKEVTGFAGWNMIGALAIAGRSQGISLLLNSFFGVLISAARGYAMQVYSALNAFALNFFTAVRPQIIKSYSVDNEDKSGEMMKLVFQSSKFCYYLIFVLSLPILIETEMFLTLWIGAKIVPVLDITVIFTRLIIVNAIIESLANPFIASIQATGKIKWYQIVTSTVILLNLPVSYLFVKFGASPEIPMVIVIIITIIAHICRFYFMNKLLKMNVYHYVKQVIFPIAAVTVLSFVLPMLYHYSFSPSFWRIVGVCGVTVVSSAIVVYFIGLTKTERNTLMNFVLKFPFTYR